MNIKAVPFHCISRLPDHLSACLVLLSKLLRILDMEVSWIQEASVDIWFVHLLDCRECCKKVYCTMRHKKINSSSRIILFMQHSRRHGCFSWTWIQIRLGYLAQGCQRGILTYPFRNPVLPPFWAFFSLKTRKNCKIHINYLKCTFLALRLTL